MARTTNIKMKISLQTCIMANKMIISRPKLKVIANATISPVQIIIRQIKIKMLVLTIILLNLGLKTLDFTLPTMQIQKHLNIDFSGLELNT